LFCISQNYSQLDSFALSIPDSLTYSPNKLANYINSSFVKNDEKLRVLYVWITTNIKYQEKLIDSLKNEDLVIYSLKTRSGKCKNYSAVLTSLCNLMGIEAYSVLGYTKSKKTVNTINDHAWNVIKSDKKYYLFDPIWDADIRNFNADEKYFDFRYYKQDSASFIKSHMPYDPVMQIKFYPITHKEFFTGKTNGQTYVNFNDSLAKYNQLNENEKLVVLLKRAEEFGIDIPELEVLYKKLKYFINNH
jgi:transglutaminase/protease-like cytokinesis protein 3